MPSMTKAYTYKYTGKDPVSLPASPHCRWARQVYPTVLSSKVGLGDLLALGGVVSLRRLAAQASPGVPVTARQLAKRPALVSR